VEVKVLKVNVVSPCVTGILWAPVVKLPVAPKVTLYTFISLDWSALVKLARVLSSGTTGLPVEVAGPGSATGTNSSKLL